MANLIDILINAKWTGGTATTKAGTDLRKLGDNATASSAEIAAANTKTGLSFGALATSIFAVTATLAAFTLTAKRLGRTVVEGAELEATTIRFDRLAESIGTTGDALRDDLGSATRGLVSDMEAMSAATDFLALGLAKNTEEAVRLTNVASQLGFNMNQLVLTLTNQTTMRFDALGVSVDGFEEKVQALEQAGLDADDAFRLAFLEQAEDQIERVGSRIETTAGQIDVIGAAWQNTLDDIKRGTTNVFEPLIARLADMIIAANDAETAVRALGDALGDLKAQEAAVKAVSAAIDEVGPRGNLLDLSSSMINTRQALKDLVGELASGGETIEEQRQILEDFGFVTDDIGVSLNDMGISWVEVRNSIDRVNLSKVSDEFSDVDAKLLNLIDHTQELNQELIYTGEQIPLDELTDFAAELGITAQQARALAVELGGTGKALELLENVESGDFFEGFENIFGGAVDVLGEMAKAVDERAELWLDFQDDLTEISEREGEQRADVEETYEKRRTELARQFGLRRVQDEEDFNRRRERADAKLQSSIDKTRQDSADQQVELRERANQRLADLERDHLDRMNDIIENADLQLIQAAGRLNAAAVVSIQQQRDRALSDEEESYRNTRDEITRQLERQIEAEREAAAERIRELEAYHAERQRIEDEDRAIRLQREQDAHTARLLEYERQEQERLDQIREQGEEGRAAREQEYEDLWDDRKDIDLKGMQDIYDAEAAWWKEREALIPQAGSGISPFVGPNATNLPPGLLQGGTSTGDITVNVNGGDSPAATGDAVRDALLQLFGGF